jgi:Flp pilus assembly protein TadD
MTEADKRRDPRFVVGRPVLLRWGQQAPRTVVAVDISARGVFLQMTAPPALDTVVAVGPVHCTVAGRVVYVLGDNDAAAMGRVPGIGVELHKPIDPDSWLLDVAESDAVAPKRGPAPVEFEGAPVRPAAARTGSGDMDASGVGGAEVVLVDFESDASRRITDALRLDDYVPLVARHSLEALTLCMRRRPLLVVVARQMPGLSGTRFLSELRARRGLDGVRAVIVENGASVVGDVAGVVRWEQVPTSVQRIRQLVDEALAGAQVDVTPRSAIEDARALAAMVFSIAQRANTENRKDDLLMALKYAAELAPSVPTYLVHYGWTLYQNDPNRNGAEALRVLERVAPMLPSTPEVHYYRGVILKDRGRFDEARGFLQRALLFDANHTGASKALAEVMQGRQKAAAAEAEAKKGTPRRDSTTDKPANAADSGAPRGAGGQKSPPHDASADQSVGATATSFLNKLFKK